MKDSADSEKKNFLDTPLKRKDYWLRILVIWIAGSAITVIETAITGDGTGTGIISTAMWVCTIVVQIPRLKDAGKSKWWLLSNLLVVLGIIIIGCFPTADDRE